jgi:DNA-binding LacI/PurR family transcriptional regulator
MTASQAQRAPTLLDVARVAGVSRTSVSNAFNRPDQLSAELRARVLGVAAKLGYSGPNPAARVLRTGRARTVGVLFYDTLAYAFTDQAAVEFLKGVADVCGREQAGMLILPAEAPEVLAQKVREVVVDGFIVYCAPGGSPLFAALASRGLPVVAVDAPEFAGGRRVLIADGAGALAAGRHLVALGHRAVGIAALALAPDGRSGPVDAARRAEARYLDTISRYDGYVAALREVGAAPVGVEEEPENDAEAGVVAARRLLALRPRPSAILAMSDVLAMGVLRAASELGLDVPEDLSVVGFDDVPFAASLLPPLTTVRQPLLDKGRLAAERLFAGAVEGIDMLPTELVVRGTTGPAPA